MFCVRDLPSLIWRWQKEPCAHSLLHHFVKHRKPRGQTWSCAWRKTCPCWRWCAATTTCSPIRACGRLALFTSESIRRGLPPTLSAWLTRLT